MGTWAAVVKSGVAFSFGIAAALLASCDTPRQYAEIIAPQNGWWENAPTTDDYKAAYPTSAVVNNISGQVMLICLILPTRHVDCAVQSETPQNWGFGDAALVLSQDFVTKPADQDQRLKIGSRIRVPVRFVVPPD